MLALLLLVALSFLTFASPASAAPGGTSHPARPAQAVHRAHQAHAVHPTHRAHPAHAVHPAHRARPAHRAHPAHRARPARSTHPAAAAGRPGASQGGPDGPATVPARAAVKTPPAAHRAHPAHPAHPAPAAATFAQQPSLLGRLGGAALRILDRAPLLLLPAARLALVSLTWQLTAGAMIAAAAGLLVLGAYRLGYRPR